MNELIERLRGYRFPIDKKRQMITVLDCKRAADRIEELEAALRQIEATCTEAISYGHTDINRVLTLVTRAALAPKEQS